MPITEEPIDESITLDNLNSRNYKIAPTPVLEQYLRENGSYTAKILLNVDNKRNIADFEKFVDSKDFADKYSVMKAANWDESEVWDSDITSEEANYLIEINRLAQEIGVSNIDADYTQRIKQAFRDDLALRTRNDILREVNKSIGLKRSNSSESLQDLESSTTASSASNVKQSGQAQIIAKLKEEVRYLERFAAPFKQVLKQSKDNDAEIDKLLEIIGVAKKPEQASRQGLLAAIRSESDADRSKAKFVKLKPEQEQSSLVQQIADLHAIIALINSGNVQGMLATQIAAQETLIETLNASLKAKAPKSTPVSIEDDKVKPINPASLLGEITKAKGLLKKTSERPKTPSSDEYSDDDNSFASSIKSRRKQIEDEDDDWNTDAGFDDDFDFDDLGSLSGGRQSVAPIITSPSAPVPIIDQVDSTLLPESERVKHLEALKKLPGISIEVAEKDINAYFAKVLAEREEAMQKHTKNMAEVIAKQQQNEAAKKPRLDQKKTHLFTAESKVAATGVGAGLEDDQVRNHLKQVLRDIEKSAQATETMLDALVIAEPSKAAELEVQREQLRDIRAGVKNPLFEWDLDEDHDGNALLEQVAQITDMASNTYGVCESVSNAAKKTKSAIGSAFTAIRDTAWAAIKLVVNGVMKLIDMVAGLFKRRKYDESAFGPVQNAADMLAYKAKHINTRGV